jgi:hypothetical protein
MRIDVTAINEFGVLENTEKSPPQGRLQALFLLAKANPRASARLVFQLSPAFRYPIRTV